MVKKSQATSKNDDYSAKDIFVLEGLEPVRKRPGMYIGSTGVDGLHHLVWEVVDNSIDEAMAGRATHIEVTLEEGHRVSVSDNGAGIPVDMHAKTKKSALETVLTTLHAGGKFGGDSYKVSGGLHGVGVSVVNALSQYVKAEVVRDGGRYIQEYVRGVPKANVKKIGSAEGHGTTISFEPDPQIFGVPSGGAMPEYDWSRILTRLRQQAYLTAGVTITVRDLRVAKNPKAYAFHFEGGVRAYIRAIGQHFEPVHDEIFYVNGEQDGIAVEAAVQYVDDFAPHELSFANNIHTTEGGMHLTGFRTALTRVLNDYARKNEIFKKDDENLSGDDVREGLSAIVAVRLKESQFEGQTKSKLGNPEARGAVEQVFGGAFAAFLEENPSNAKQILAKVILAAKARKAAKAAKDSILRKGALTGLTLPGKLADCQSKNAEDSEIFLVEGDSAGGSAKQARNRATQAILPLKGKILNVERARLDKILAFSEIRALVIAMGAGIGDEFNIEKLRYHKIVIMTDADVDGAHIRTLLLTFFYRHYLPIIEAGFLYIAEPPLFRVQKGKQIHYAFSENQRDEIVSTLQAAKEEAKAAKAKKSGEEVIEEEVVEEVKEGEGVGENIKGINLQRYKGLGEMNPDQLWDTTMDPTKRRMRKVNIEDAQEADIVFDLLMGAEVAPRKHFIQSRARAVKNLDV